MTLSEYEKTQFENLTADFEVEDAKALKKMKKLDKASALSFSSLPDLRLVPLVVAAMALLFAIAGRITGNDLQMLTAGGITLLCIWVSMIVNPHTPAEVIENEEEDK